MNDEKKMEVSDALFENEIDPDSQKFDTCIATYKAQLQQGDIQKVYHYLLRYLMHLKAYISSSMPTEFSCGNISPGYMDFSYFPFFDNYLRERKLRFGIVLNHRELRFELWLMGQNAVIQNTYWCKLKNSPWNTGRTEMPKYSILEAVLIETPNFKKPDQLTIQIKEEVIRVSKAITNAIKTAENLR